MAFRILYLGCLLALVASPVLAASISSPWNTGVMRKADGSFAYCVSEAQYDNGLWLILALNATGDANMGVGQRGAQLPIGGERLSTLQIEDQTAQQFPARVTKPDLYVINLGRNEAFLEALAVGNRLLVDNNTFTLSGTAQALEILRECVRVTAATAATAATDPASVLPAPPPGDWKIAGQSVVTSSQASAPADVSATPVASVPTRVVIAPEIAVPLPTPKPQTAESVRAPLQLPPELETPVIVTPPVVLATPVSAPVPVAVPKLAPELAVPVPQIEFTPAPSAAPTAPALPAQLLQLLGRAGLKDIQARPATSGEAFAWRAGALLGELREVSVPAGAALDKLIEADLTQLRVLCSGAFTSEAGKTEAVKGLSLSRAYTSCTIDNKTMFSTHVYSLTPSGILSAVTHVQSGGRAAAERAQTGLLEALRD